tara:strand:+ start:175 stop:522 length:348 start_codon:yes stop_codon:yes gene_type:complete
MRQAQELLKIKYSKLKEILELCEKMGEHEFKFESNLIENNEDIKNWLDNNKDDIKKIFKYPNYCNLDNSKKQISQYIKLMCKDLSIPIKKKVRSVQIGNKRTSNRAIFMIELEDI